MAEIYLKVPEAWPDFQVTSYKRKTGTHAKGFAFDIAISGNWDKGPGSTYWYYYFETIFMLWAAQRRGRVWLAAPPFCSHYHIDTEPNQAYMGLEWTYPRKQPNGKTECVYNNHIEQMKVSDAQGVFANAVDYNSWFRMVREAAEPFVKSWANEKLRIGSLFTKNSKWIGVSSNGLIPERDLQAKLINTFGDGGTWQYVADNVSQLLSYQNADDLAENFWEHPAVLIGGALLVFGALYYAAKQNQQPESAAPTKLITP